MHVVHALDRFQLHNEFVFHQEVETVRPDQSSSVLDGTLELSQKLQSLVRQFYAESAVVRALQKAWPERAMHGNCAADGAF